MTEQIKKGECWNKIYWPEYLEKLNNGKGIVYQYNSEMELVMGSTFAFIPNISWAEKKFINSYWRLKN